jgi:nitrogen fixation protein NifQ
MMHRSHLPSEPDGAPAGCDDEEALALRALGAVFRHAQEGELPLFAWTLGLPQAELLDLLDRYFPQCGTLQPMREHEYQVIERTVPPEFTALSALLLLHCTAGEERRLCGWLARAIAAAAFGSRHLWEDLGMPGRDAVSALMRRYFAPLYRKNVLDLRWKRFLFAEAGARTGNPDLRPPECGGCDQLRNCFPAAAPASASTSASDSAAPVPGGAGTPA